MSNDTIPVPTGADAAIAQLREALEVAHGHIDMEALRISHCKDAALIEAALVSAAQPAGEYPPLPGMPAHYGCGEPLAYTATQMRAYVDADRAQRASRGQAPAPAAVAGPTMDEAVAAVDGTLHGAIDYWQQRALEAEQRVAPAAQGDADRLDFLDKAHAGGVRLDDRSGLAPQYAYWGPHHKTKTARAAIDAARAQAKEGGAA
ncbi:hypothetical protein [Pulveribacter sp.]|uniref:hypothetical protein n=1 Tax=Pulveribacter sp. TaxID=2678893 RepID=UPI0028B0988C|nr:hypothetical protein [Pulveribacter sp.]